MAVRCETGASRRRRQRQQAMAKRSVKYDDLEERANPHWNRIPSALSRRYRAAPQALKRFAR
eukprot:9484094-Prorocentrum_lima.AAC.1